MNIQGKIHSIGEVQQKTDSFRVREIVIEYTDNPLYPQYVSFQMNQERVDLVHGYNVGDRVDVAFNIRGRQWQSPQGEIKYFNTLEAWRISPLQAGAMPQGQRQAQAQPVQQSPQQPQTMYPNQQQNTNLFGGGMQAQPPQVPTGDDDDLPF